MGTTAGEPAGSHLAAFKDPSRRSIFRQARTGAPVRSGICEPAADKVRRLHRPEAFALGSIPSGRIRTRTTQTSEEPRPGNFVGANHLQFTTATARSHYRADIPIGQSEEAAGRTLHASLRQKDNLSPQRQHRQRSHKTPTATTSPTTNNRSTIHQSLDGIVKSNAPWPRNGVSQFDS